MQRLLELALFIDRMNDRVAAIAKWSIAAACAISAANAFVRYGFNFSSNAFLEIQWYLFAACVMFGTSQVLRVNEHVRVDILYNIYPTRGKVFVDIMGLSLFLMPMCLLIIWLILPLVTQQFLTGETSSNAGGLIRWPVTATVPLGLGLLALQGVSEIIKRVAWLMHKYEMDTHYERPLQ